MFNNKDNKWAPLVYARTFNVDFRLIKVPADFNDQRVTWVIKYINFTTRYPQRLRQRPCWSFFQDNSYCVFGVTCMVRELLVSHIEENSENFTQDSCGRELFAFVGYVSRIPRSHILSMKLELFKELYESYVQPIWNYQYYEVRDREKQAEHFSDYEKSFDLDSYSQQPENWTGYSFNTDNNISLICPVNANENLWYAASQEENPLSICLNLSNKKYFVDGDFLNGTAVNVIGDNPEKIQKNTKINENLVLAQPEELSSTTQAHEDEFNVAQKPQDQRNSNIINILGKALTDVMRYIFSWQDNFVPHESRNRYNIINTVVPSDKESDQQDSELILTKLILELERKIQFIKSKQSQKSTKESFRKNNTQSSNTRIKEDNNQINKFEINIQNIRKKMAYNSSTNYLCKAIDDINAMLKQVNPLAEHCGWSEYEQSKLTSHENFNPESEDQNEIESQNTDIDYSPEEKSEKNQSKQKDWF